MIIERKKRIYKILQHLGLWSAYILYNATKDLAFHPIFLNNIIADFHGALYSAVIVYVNLYFLIPKYLIKRKYWHYSMFLLLLTLSFSLFTAQSLNKVLEIDFFGTTMGHMATFLDNFVLIAITTAFNFVTRWYERDNYAKDLEKQNIEAELSLLKNTINPHFLFNSLNTIYFLIKKSSINAQKVLMELSDMLSHQLYDCKDKYIQLKKEIEYLQNYISIEKIRQSDIVNIEFCVNGEVNNRVIAPMLLLPFVENAFKYGFKSGLNSYNIDISIDITEDKLFFNCKNDYKKIDDPSTKKGIGLENVKRRLALIYPEKHNLEIIDYGQQFEIKLSLSV